jgi:hypothetical protein
MRRGAIIKTVSTVPSSHYLAIESFTRMIKNSHSLTPTQKSALWKQARDGDLDGARMKYARLVTIRGREIE